MLLNRGVRLAWLFGFFALFLGGLECMLQKSCRRLLIYFQVGGKNGTCSKRAGPSCEGHGCINRSRRRSQESQQIGTQLNAKGDPGGSLRDEIFFC